MTLVSHLPALGLMSVRVKGLGPASALCSPSGIPRFSEHVPPSSKEGGFFTCLLLLSCCPTLGTALERSPRSPPAGKLPHSGTKTTHTRSLSPSNQMKVEECSLKNFRVLEAGEEDAATTGTRVQEGESGHTADSLEDLAPSSPDPLPSSSAGRGKMEGIPKT